MAPLDVKPVPPAVQTRLTETAFVLDHDKVYPAFAVIIAGERETLIVGAAEGAMVVMVSERCAVAPPAFVAVQVHVDGKPTQPGSAVPLSGPWSAMAPFDVKPVPVAVHTRASETALDVVQVSE